jgi:hypothetical protein
MNERLRAELHKYLIVSSYLFVCFAALLLFEAVNSGGAGAHPLKLSLAAGKALILGKFLLLGDAAAIGTRGRTRNLLQRILRRSVLLMVLLVLLTIVEEMVVGRFHGRPVAQTLAEMDGGSLLHVVTNCFVLLLVIMPLVAVAEINQALGPGVLRNLLLSEKAERGG